jgi:hypothetical protein
MTKLGVIIVAAVLALSFSLGFYAGNEMNALQTSFSNQRLVDNAMRRIAEDRDEIMAMATAKVEEANDELARARDIQSKAMSAAYEIRKQAEGDAAKIVSEAKSASRPKPRPKADMTAFVAANRWEPRKIPTSHHVFDLTQPFSGAVSQ